MLHELWKGDFCAKTLLFRLVGFSAGGFANTGFNSALAGGFGNGGGGFNNAQNKAKNKGKTQWNKATLKQQIQTDFSVTKSVWPFSSYGVPDEPSLMPGDFSFEEVRLQAYVEASQGRFQQQIAREQQMGEKMTQDRNKLLRDPFSFIQPPNQNANTNSNVGAAWGGAPNNNNQAQGGQWGQQAPVGAPGAQAGQWGGSPASGTPNSGFTW